MTPRAMALGPSLLRIAVLADEPTHAAYVASALQLALPGQAEVTEVRHVVGTDADLLLVPAAARLTLAAATLPVLVLADGPLPLAEIEGFLQAGADDVIDLARLSAAALAATLLKAVRRQARHTPRTDPVAGLLGGSPLVGTPSVLA